MNHPTIFTADHNGFYLNGTSFYPLIQNSAEPILDWSNTVAIRLPAHRSDDLNWSREKEFAKRIIAAGKYLFWEIDLDLCSFALSPDDSATFYSFTLAIVEFSKQLWTDFQNHTFGVSLYCAKFPPLHSFALPRWEIQFSEWESGLGLRTESDHELFCAQALSEYLHRLVSFLPDMALPFALFDVSNLSSKARVAQLLSKSRFEHLNLIIKGAKAPFSGICWGEGQSAQGWYGDIAKTPNTGHISTAPNIGVLLPNDAYMNSALINNLDSLFLDLIEKKIFFRIVPEEKLTEQWDGLDELIVMSNALTAQGKRKLLGFEAAGGKILTIEETYV